MRAGRFSWGVPAALLMLLGTLAGCDEPNKTYGAAPDRVAAILVGTTIPSTAFGHAAHSVPGAATLEGVTWDITRGDGNQAGPAGAESGSVVMRLTAALTAVPGGTQISVALEAPAGGDPTGVEKLTKDSPAIVKMWLSIAREHVDASLTCRSFSMAAIRQDMAVAVIAQLPMIRQQMDEASKEYHQQNRENLESAYANEGRGFSRAERAR